MKNIQGIGFGYAKGADGGGNGGHDGWSLAACEGEAEAPVAAIRAGPSTGHDQSSNARACPGPRRGQMPAAVYFDLAYEGDKGLTIRKAESGRSESER